MGLRVGIPPYPWGSCLERGTAAEDAYKCVRMCVCQEPRWWWWWWGTLCVSCGGHTEPPPPTAATATERGDATDAFHGCMPCARLRCYGPRSAPRILAPRPREKPIVLFLPSIPRPRGFARGFLVSNFVEVVPPFFLFAVFPNTVAGFVVSWKRDSIYFHQGGRRSSRRGRRFGAFSICRFNRLKCWIDDFLMSRHEENLVHSRCV